MSKNLTRKGIAFGALVALGTSLISGAPASAAVTTDIVTELNGGTSYNSVVGYGNDLSLKTTFAPAQAANAAALTYHVENPSGATVGINVSSTATRLDGTTDTAEIWDVEATPAINSTDSDSAETGTQTTLRSFNVVLKGTSVGTSALDNIVSFDVKDADADVSLNVYAWLDTSSAAANQQASTEAQGNTVELKFYDQKNVTAVSELVSPVTGAAYVEATFTTTPELNGQQLGTDFIDGSWTTQGNANAVLAKYTDDDAATGTTGRGTTTYSGTTKKWTSKAYLAYSQANDAFNGTNLTSFKLSTISTTATVQHGVPLATFADLDDIGLVAGATGYIANADYRAVTASTYRVIRSAVTVVSATSIQVTSDYQATDSAARDVTVSGSFIEFWTAGTYSTVQASGVYSATPYIGTQKLGAAGSSTTSSITPNDTKATISVSENVSAASNENGGAGTTVNVRTGTTSIDVVATIYYTDADTGVSGKVAPAGIPVTGAISGANAGGVFQINAAGAGVTSKVLYTDANGQVKFTVSTSTASLTANALTLDIYPASVASGAAGAAQFIFDWADAAYTLFDLNDTYSQDVYNGVQSYRRINTGGTYTYNFAVLDQWGKAADSAKYRLQVSNTGRTSSSNYHTLSNGRVSVAVADAAQGTGSTIETTVTVQKLITDTWTAQDASWDGTASRKAKATINVADAATETFTLGSTAGSTYTATRGGHANDLVSTIAAKAVIAQDRRTSALTQPAYADSATVTGRITDKLTGLARGGAAVTVSGPSTILFSAGNVDALGSITVLADADGDINVSLFSNIAQEDAVITFTSASGATKTVKVTFSPALTTSGSKMTLVASAATPGKTLVFTGKLVDSWGNGVKTSDATSRATLRVTYTGPGLLSGALPTETEEDGTFTVRVLLGTSDTGSATVKATYGAKNLVISSADTGDDIDITATATAVIGGAAATSATAAVSGSTGKFYVSVTNAAAKKVVIKVAGKFVKSFTGTAAKKTVVTKATKGSKKVTVYVGGKLVATKTVTVK